MPVLSGVAPLRIAACVDDVAVGAIGMTRGACALIASNDGAPNRCSSSARSPSNETRTTRFATPFVTSRGGGGGMGGAGGGGGVLIVHAVRRMQNAECRNQKTLARTFCLLPSAFCIRRLLA